MEVFLCLENCYGGDKMLRNGDKSVHGGDNWLYDGDKEHQVGDKLLI